jgi:hypothetical protein
VGDMREKILMSTLSLVTESGFQGASISKIIEKSGVSNGGIYSAFKNRDAIFEALYWNIKEDLNEKHFVNFHPNLSFYDALYQYWNSKIIFGLKHPDKLKYLDQFYHSPYYSKLNLTNNYTVFTEILKKAIKNKQVVDLDVDFILIDINSNINSVFKYLSIKSIENQQQFIEMSFRKYWRSIINLNLY